MNNEDFITIKKLNTTDISSDMIKVAFLDWEKGTQSTLSSQYPQTSKLKLKEKTIKIDKDYNKNLILKEFIEKVIEISEPETYNEKVYEYKTVREINSVKEHKQLLSKMINCSTYIATNGRIGPAHFILIPHKYYQKLSDLIIDGKIGGMKIIPTNLLNDKMIFGRKNDETQPGIFLFLDEKINKYNLNSVGDFAQNQYHILKITYLQDERKKKLDQIENR